MNVKRVAMPGDTLFRPIKYSDWLTLAIIRITKIKSKSRYYEFFLINITSVIFHLVFFINLLIFTKKVRLFKSITKKNNGIVIPGIKCIKKHIKKSHVQNRKRVDCLWQFATPYYLCSLKLLQTLSHTCQFLLRPLVTPPNLLLSPSQSPSTSSQPPLNLLSTSSQPPLNCNGVLAYNQKLSKLLEYYRPLAVLALAPPRISELSIGGHVIDVLSLGTV